MMEARQYPGMLPSVSYKPRMMGINFPSSTSLRILAFGFLYSFNSLLRIAVVFIIFSPPNAIIMHLLEKINHYLVRKSVRSNSYTLNSKVLAYSFCLYHGGNYLRVGLIAGICAIQFPPFLVNGEGDGLYMNIDAYEERELLMKFKLEMELARRCKLAGLPTYTSDDMLRMAEEIMAE